MKIKRFKKVNRHLAFYVNNFGFRQPYQVLLDGTFCLAALNNKINIADNISRYLQGELKPVTTQCAIIEMENLGSKLGGALLILKRYVVHKCGHEGKPIPASICVISMIGKRNEQHYIVASQDRDLQNRLRGVVGVPLLYLHGKTPVLEQPSQVSLGVVKDKASGISEVERETINRLKLQGGLLCGESVKVRRKNKKKGANPLSCKRKNRVQRVGKVVKQDGAATKVKRKKVRIPQHVKEALCVNKD